MRYIDLDLYKKRMLLARWMIGTSSRHTLGKRFSISGLERWLLS